MKRKKEFDQKIKMLCEDLAINHARNSIIYQNDKGQEKLKKILSVDEEKTEKSSRNIVIIGSGASYDAYNDIFPKGPESVDLIEKKMKFDFIKEPSKSTGSWTFSQQLNKKYKSIYARLHLNPKLTDKSFETRLALMSHFFEGDDVRNEIAHLFQYRTFPSYFYEIIAHLLKNRFIEGVINFNFDELLDQAIDEEVGSGQIKRIISDGDFIPYSKMLTMDKLREPFYIKPHGTASHKSSMLFTKEQYLDIPTELEELMEEIFVGQTIYKDGSGEYIEKNSQFDTLNLIIFGFAMQSIEFNAVLKRAYERIKSTDNKRIVIYYFSYRDSLTKCISLELEEIYKSSYSKNEASEMISDLRKVMNKSEDLKMLKKALINERINIADVSKKVKKWSIDQEVEDLNKIFNQDEKSCEKIEIKVIPLPKDNTTGPVLNEAIGSIESIVSKYFTEPYKPSHPIRHQLLCDVFTPLALKKSANCLLDFYRSKESHEFIALKKKLYYNSKEYYLQRVIFEIILVVIKNRGYIQPRESLKGINRVGYYYHLYYNSFSDTQKAKSIHTILKNLGLNCKKSSIAKEIYTLPKSVCSKNQIFSSHCIDLGAWISYMESLFKKKAKTNKKIREHDQPYSRYCKRTYKFTLKTLEKVRTESESDNITKKSKIHELLKRNSLSLYPNFQDFQLNYFGHIDPVNIIPTTTALKFRFLDHFYSDDWNTLLLTSDRGLELISALKMAKKNNIKFYKKQRTIHLILADIHKDVVSQLKRKIQGKNKIKLHIHTIPFYDHNSHMKLFFKSENKTNYSSTNALFYYKKGFSNNINAVHLRPENNLRNVFMLIEKFLSYYCKALSYEVTQQSMGHFKNQERVIDTLVSYGNAKGKYKKNIQRESKNLFKLYSSIKAQVDKLK